MEVAFGLHAATFSPMSETREIIDELKKRQVRFLLLQFTGLLGVNKAVEVPSSQFERALAGEVTFDGSALEGFPRFFFQAEDGIRDVAVTGVQTCALPI